MPASRPEDVAATFCATVVDEWIRAGVRHAVIAPGSRSTPLALALAGRSELRVDVYLDERSAAFAALGSGLASGRPAVVLCTSGTAATHLHGAVVEADLAGVPMLVCTADRPPELHGVGAAQTIEQDRLFAGSVRWFHAPGVPDAAASSAWRSMAARAHLAAVGPDPGPVHLNLAFREPLVGREGELPAGRAGGEPWLRAVTGVAGGAVADTELLQLTRLLDRQRGVIVAGAGCGAASAIGDLADATGWPVLADPRSGARQLPDAVIHADALLRSPAFAAAHTPAVVLRLGEPPASKVLAQWIAASGADEVHVSARPAVSDPAHRLAMRVVTDPAVLCRRLAAGLTGARGTPWAARWRHADGTAREIVAGHIGGQLSEPGVAAAVLAALPPESNLVVSSSMPVRAVEWFGPDRGDVRVLANRGANGIDGVLATAAGVAAASGMPTGVLLGDVAMLHDSSTLTGLRSRDLDLRIVVLDNDGGGIFSFLPQRDALPAERFEQLFGTPHGTDLVGLAQAHGIVASSAGTLGDVAAFVAQPGPALLRVGLDRAVNVEAYAAINAAVVAAVERGR